MGEQYTNNVRRDHRHGGIDSQALLGWGGGWMEAALGNHEMAGVALAVIEQRLPAAIAAGRQHPETPAGVAERCGTRGTHSVVARAIDP